MSHPETLPTDAKIFVIGNDKAQLSGDVFNKKKLAVIFGTPGAFTPTCTQKHLPSFMHRAKEMKALGVDLIACVTPNDKYVIEAWSEEMNVDPDLITLVSDGNLEFTTSLGLATDRTLSVMGHRFSRFSLISVSGKIIFFRTEPPNCEFNETSADVILAFLKSTRNEPLE